MSLAGSSLGSDQSVHNYTRRRFLSTAGSSVAALALERSLFGQQTVRPSDKLTVACIGVGAQGQRVLIDLLRMPQVQVIAVCDANQQSSTYLEWGTNELRNKVRLLLADPDWGAQFPGPTAGRDTAQAITNAFYAKATGKPDFRGCSAYADFRELLAKEKDLDAVVISTPDHWHAVIAIAAMRAGKHVYSQKPMAHTAWEARQMAKVANETGRATQVSIFNAQTPASLNVIHLIQSGVIGPVHSVDLWTNRPAAFWKQGLPTPTTADPVPAGLDWDLWLGPAAMRPYNHSYLPFVWRAWYPFGCGAIGDMGEYGFDTIVRALDLGPASRVGASSSELFPECYPVASMLQYQFPEKGSGGTIHLNWFDGGLKPERPAELPPAVSMSSDDQGVMYSGEKGKLLAGFMSDKPRILSPAGVVSPAPAPLIPAGAPFDPTRPELGPSATAADASHYMEWVRACQGGPPASSSYPYAAPIVESLMLGNVALRTEEVLEWDSAAFRLTTGSERATRLLTPEYRAPWSAS